MSDTNVSTKIIFLMFGFVVWSLVFLCVIAQRVRAQVEPKLLNSQFLR